MNRNSNLWTSCAFVAAVTASACGDDVARGDEASTTDGLSVSSTEAPTGSDATSTGTDAGTNSIDESLSGSTGVVEQCEKLHEGSLGINDESDLDALGEIGHVTGDVYISFKEKDQRDLSFLKCLQKIDARLLITGNMLLESTEGLGKLSSVGQLSIIDNPNLRFVAGFESLNDLNWLDFKNNPAVEEMSFDSLKHVGSLYIGSCQLMQGNAKNLSLVSLGGFDGISTIEGLYVDGNEALMTADILESLAANGASAPLGFAAFRFNPVLSEAVVNEQLDLLGVMSRDVCGNAKGDPQCECPVG